MPGPIISSATSSALETFKGKYSSAVVGLLACQLDSYLKTLTTTVVSCREIAKPEEPAKNGKASKTAKKQKGAEVEVPAENPAKYEIELADTVIFPEGGGQPSDTGIITIKETNKKIPVFAVKRNGLTALHETPEFISAGIDVEVSVNWARRFDHMQQHTGQHLLSAILDQREVPTLGWGMGKTIVADDATPASAAATALPSFNYIEIGRKLSPQEIDEVQSEINEAINDCLDIQVNIPDSNKSLADSEVIDPNTDKGVIRHVTIGKLDNNPCCGTHLRSTGHVSALSIFNHSQSIRGTNSRIFFLAGNRVIQYARAANDQIRKVNSTLSCTTEDIELKLGELATQLKNAKSAEKYWSLETASKDARGLKNAIAAFPAEGAFSGIVLYNERGTMDYFRAVEKELGPLDQLSAASFVIVFAGGQAAQSGLVIVAGTDKDVIDETAKKIKEVIPDIKGGGKGKWQGKVTSWKTSEIKGIESLF